MRRSLIALASLLAPFAAFADSDGEDMADSPMVPDICTIAAGASAFGADDTVSGSAVDGTAALPVACANGASVVRTLWQGSNPDSRSDDAARPRQVGSGTEHRGDSLFRDADEGAVWGRAESPGVPYEAESSAASDVTAYGGIDASQELPAGTDADTLVAAVAF